MIECILETVGRIVSGYLAGSHWEFLPDRWTNQSWVPRCPLVYRPVPWRHWRWVVSGRWERLTRIRVHVLVWIDAPSNTNAPDPKKGEQIKKLLNNRPDYRYIQVILIFSISIEKFTMLNITWYISKTEHTMEIARSKWYSKQPFTSCCQKLEFILRERKLFVLTRCSL